jgi:hypothetical protein
MWTTFILPVISEVIFPGIFLTEMAGERQKSR